MYFWKYKSEYDWFIYILNISINAVKRCISYADKPTHHDEIIDWREEEPLEQRVILACI